MKGDLSICSFLLLLLLLLSIDLLFEVFIVNIHNIHFFCDIPCFSFQPVPKYKLIDIHTQSSTIHCPTDCPYSSIMACVHLPSSHFFGVILILHNNPYRSLTKTSVLCKVALKQSRSKTEKKKKNPEGNVARGCVFYPRYRLIFLGRLRFS